MKQLNNVADIERLFSNNMLYSVQSDASKEIFRNSKIEYSFSSNVFILKDKYMLSVRELLENKESSCILVSVLACDMIKERYPESDLASLILMVLGDKAVENSSLIRFCLVLMKSKYNGSKFIKFLLSNLGYTENRIEGEASSIACCYIC